MTVWRTFSNKRPPSNVTLMRWGTVTWELVVVVCLGLARVSRLSVPLGFKGGRPRVVLPDVVKCLNSAYIRLSFTDDTAAHSGVNERRFTLSRLAEERYNGQSRAVVQVGRQKSSGCQPEAGGLRIGIESAIRENSRKSGCRVSEKCQTQGTDKGTRVADGGNETRSAGAGVVLRNAGQSRRVVNASIVGIQINVHDAHERRLVRRGAADCVGLEQVLHRHGPRVHVNARNSDAVRGAADDAVLGHKSPHAVGGDDSRQARSIGHVGNLGRLERARINFQHAHKTARIRVVDQQEEAVVDNVVERTDGTARNAEIGGDSGEECLQIE